MTAKALAAVMTGPGKTALRELPIPHPQSDDGLLRIDLCGVAESDPNSFRRGDLAPAILGHEIVGTIERAGEAARARWRLREGDRAIVQEYLPCRACDWCAKGEYRLCAGAQMDAPAALRIGMTGTGTAPGLWGGFAQYLYLHPRLVLHSVPAGLSDSLASLTLPVANGLQALAVEGGLSPGQAILIFGCSLSGLAAACAAADAGAGAVIVCGLARETMRRALGKSFGATHVLTGDEEGLDERIAAATLGKGADIVVDASSDTSGRVAATAIKAAAVGATLVLGGIGQVPLNIGEIRRKYLTIKPVRGHSTNAVERALTLLQRHSGIFSAMPSRSFPLSETANAIAAGNAELSPEIVRAELRPWK